MKQTSPIEQHTFRELLKVTGIDPSDQAPENRQYSNVLGLASRFIAWTDAVKLEPVLVQKELVYDTDSKDKLRTRPGIEAPRIAKRFFSKGKEKPTDSHDENHHDDKDYEYPDDKVVKIHVHEHGPNGNLILPRLVLRRNYTPRTGVHRESGRLWPVSNLATGLPPFPTNHIWYVGQKIYPEGQTRVGIFDNDNGRVKTGPAMNLAMLREIKPPKKPNGKLQNLVVPDMISTTRILRAAARYATERNLDHTKF